MGQYLVCYFSPTGTTRSVGEQIAEVIGADLWEIRPKKAYSARDLDWQKYFARCNREHRRDKFPVLAGPMPPIDAYGIVFLGFPIWYETVPNIILSFLKSVDWTGQHVVLFGTSGGSGIRQARADVRIFLSRKGDIPAAGILDPSSPEMIRKWAKDALDLITKKNRTDAEEYVKKNYVEPVPVVKEDQAPYGDQEKSAQKDSKPKFSREFERYSLDIDASDDLQAELQRLRRENEVLRRRQELHQRTGLNRSVMDRYDPRPIEQILRNASTPAARSSVLRTLDSYTDQSFVGKLMALIREKGMKEPDVYRAALIDRKLFSKITSDQNYKPAKDTCIALAYALKLTLAEANDLLSRAGYTLSHSNKRDVILEYFFSAGKYNLFDINEILSQMNQQPLGRQS